MKSKKRCFIAFMLSVLMMFSALQISSIMALGYEGEFSKDLEISEDSDVSEDLEIPEDPDTTEDLEIPEDSDTTEDLEIPKYLDVLEDLEVFEDLRTLEALEKTYISDMYVFSPDAPGEWLLYADDEQILYIEEVHDIEILQAYAALMPLSLPITVHNRADFVNALTTPTANRMIRLYADINLGAWLPIDLSGAAAHFTLDGNGHTLTFSVNSGNGPAGLFGTIAHGNVTILNLGLNINGSVRRHGAAYRGVEQMAAGALIGRVHGGRVLVERSFVSGGEVYARRNAANTHGDAFAGGFFGVIQSSADVIVIDSFVNSNVRAYAVAGTGVLGPLRLDTPRAAAGGFVGMLWGSSSLTIKNSYAAGSVYARSRSASIHPLPTAVRSVGGILGAIWDKTDSALGMNIAHANSVSHSGDLLGVRNTIAWGTVRSESQLRNSDTVPLNRWNWDTVWEYRAGVNNGLPVLSIDGFTGIVAPEFIVMYHGLSGQYNQNIAILSAELLYCWPYSDLNYQESLAYWGFDFPREGFDMSPDNAFVRFGIKTLPNGTHIVAVLLRGTSGELSEWLGNFTVGMFSGNFDRNHADFARAAHIAHIQLLAYLQDHNIALTGDNTRFLIAGSSRGAAIANVLSHRLMTEDGVPSNHLFSYNFAGPDVAIRRMNSWGNYRNIINIRNFNDPVTRVPGTIGNVILTLDSPGYHWGKFGQSLWWPGSVGIFSTLFAGLEFAYYDPHNIPYYRHQVMNYPLPWGSTCGLRHFLAVVTAFKCPVDIRVYDEDGVHIASIEDNELVYFNATPDQLQVFILGDAKYIVILDGNEYDIHLVGTDTGILNYFVTVVEITEETVLVDEYFSTIETSMEILDQRMFVDVTLYYGRQMLTAVGGDIDVSDVALLISVDDVVVGEIDERGNEQWFEYAAHDQDHGTHTQSPPATNQPGSTHAANEPGAPITSTSESYADLPLQNVIPAFMPFTDIVPTSWYYSFVRLVWENQLFQGTSHNLFTPQGNMTRAMFVQVLYRIEHGALIEENENPNSDHNTQRSSLNAQFADVSAQAWYYDAVEWAARQGLVNGVGDGNFAPNRPITRGEMAVLLSNYIVHTGIAFPQNTVAPFADQDGISPWAVSGVTMLQGAGIIIGHFDGRFAAQDIATRAEVATVFARFFEI
ncbi:MAG: S-layer homology domain-containing protein [Oscillospiraceae bacterium]|nr:S-layer homology domain-containing protein [Oscillospiraceae bacterium]